MGLEAKTLHLELHCAHELHPASQSVVEVVQVQPQEPFSFNTFEEFSLKGEHAYMVWVDQAASRGCPLSGKLLLCLHKVVSQVAGMGQCLSPTDWLLILSQASPHLLQKLQGSEVSTGWGWMDAVQSVQSIPGTGCGWWLLLEIQGEAVENSWALLVWGW